MVLHLDQEASIRVRMVGLPGLLSRLTCRMLESLRWLRPHRRFTRQSTAAALSKLQMEEVVGQPPTPVYGALSSIVLSNIPPTQRLYTPEQLGVVPRMPLLLN